jgi:23S rRNA-/tRNA-specific pseudouridylate synthase
MEYWLSKIFNGYSQSLVNYLCQKFSIGKGNIYKFIDDKKILVNNKKINKSYRIKNGDHLIIKYPLCNNNGIDDKFYSGKSLFKYENLESFLKNIIFFENENFWVVNKPYSWATQDGHGNPYNLDDLFKYFFQEHYLVHRLDQETSGLLLISKNRQWANILSQLMLNHKIQKYYLLWIPKINKNNWVVKSYIGDKNNINNEINAVTIFKKIKDDGDYSLVEAQLISGKKHQIRIHCHQINHSIIGDNKYKGQQYQRLMLHSYKIKFFYHQDYEFILHNNDFH